MYWPANPGVMLTGSHNPSNYNGFKIVIAGDTLANEQIQALRQRIETNDLASGVGSVEQIDILDRYFNQIRDDIALAKPMRVVVDCGNGVAGVIAPRLIEALGCSVIPLFCEVDGNFPNHHPDPGKPENLVDLIANGQSRKRRPGPGLRRRWRPRRRGHQHRHHRLPGSPADAVRQGCGVAQPRRRHHLRRQMHPPPDAADQRLRWPPGDVEDRPLADQEENEGNRRPAGRRNERAYLLQGALVRLRRRHLRRRPPAGNPQPGQARRRARVLGLPQRHLSPRKSTSR